MLSGWEPRGLASGTGSLGTLISSVNPMGSPRLMGELAYASGKISPARRGINQAIYQSGQGGEERNKRRRLSRRQKLSTILEQRGAR